MQKYIMLPLLAIACFFISPQAFCEENYLDHIKKVLKSMEPTAAADSCLFYMDAFTVDQFPYVDKKDIVVSTLIPYGNKHKITPVIRGKLYYAAALYSSHAGPDPDFVDCYVDSALMYVEKGDTSFPDYYFIKGRMLELKALNVQRFRDYADAYGWTLKALKSYEQAGDCQWRMSRCLYQLAITYLNHDDHEGLGKVITQLEEVARNAPESVKNAILYDVYSVKETYFGVLFEAEADKKRKAEYLDSLLAASHNAIWLLENKIEWVGTNINPVWNYYNRAAVMTSYYDRPNVDSVEYYFKKALDISKQINAVELTEIQVSIETMRGEMWSKLGDFQRAEKSLLKAVELMEEDSLRKNQYLPDRVNVLQSLIKMSEANNRYADALKYYRRLSEVEHEKYDIEKTSAIKDLEVKYDVERKEMEIDNLNERNRQARKIMWLLIGGSAVLLAGAVMAIIVMRQRRMIAEQKYYEAALLVEQRDKALTEGFFSPGIDKVKEILKDSALDTDTKERYAEKLNGLNIAELDGVFAPARDKMTQMDLKYTVCFYIGMETADIAAMMNVEQASVYTVRYRLKKKFREYAAFRFLM